MIATTSHGRLPALWVPHTRDIARMGSATLKAFRHVVSTWIATSVSRPACAGRSRGRGRASLAIALLVAATALVLLSGLEPASTSRDVRLELRGADTVFVHGAPNELKSVDFRLVNRTGIRLSPRVQKTNCGCNRFEFLPELVDPGQSCTFRTFIRVPLWGGRTAQSYVLGAPGGAVEDRIPLTVRAVADEKPGIGIAPTTISWESLREGATALASGHQVVEILLDVVYVLGQGYVRPTADISLRGPGVRLRSTESVYGRNPAKLPTCRRRRMPLI